MEHPNLPYDDEELRHYINNFMEASRDENHDYEAYATDYESLRHQPTRINTELTRRDEGTHELERYDPPSMLVDVEDSFLSREDECFEYEDEEFEERRADPIFVDAEVIQPVLKYQKEEPLLLTYQPSEDEGTLAAINILNARSVPEAFCCFFIGFCGTTDKTAEKTL